MDDQDGPLGRLAERELTWRVLLIKTEIIDMNDLELAYLAGFFDADGCVCIARKKAQDYKRGVSFRLIVEVSQKQRKILETFREFWGGSILVGKRCDRWLAYSTHALTMLQDLMPYLRMKKSEAEIALAFQEEKQGRLNRGCLGISDAEFESDRIAHQKMKDIKRARNKCCGQAT